MQLLSSALLGLVLSSCTTTAVTPRVAPPAPYGATPNAAQVKQAERAYYAFVHLTLNTFTDREWGLGTESESIFNPTAFDADQIAGAIRAGGAKGLVLTCKHHDGFCLWPTKTTEHNISASPFKNGKGDLVGDIAAATRQAGMDFGVYLSPWDRNHPTYGKPEYIEVYRSQLRELLTGYGPVFEIWMDGANGGSGYYRGKVGPTEFKGSLETRSIDNRSYYDWPNTWALMKQLQPDAVLLSDVGPDMRWCGNEHGHAPDTVWSTITYGPDHRPGANIPHLASGTRNGKQWVMSEVDVSIRPGWFWHENQNSKVRSPQNLMDIYVGSVGHGTSLILNVPPDRRGLVHEIDAASLKIFGDHLKATFANNLAAGAKAVASNVRGQDPFYGPQKLLDPDLWSAWISDDTVHTPEVIIKLNGAQTFNLIQLREDIRLGQRLEGVAVDVWENGLAIKQNNAEQLGQWKELAKAESIGSCRLWRVPKTTSAKLRIRVTKSSACPALSDFGLFLEPEMPKWTPPGSLSPAAMLKKDWKILSASTELAGGEPQRAIDGDPATLWHTHASSGESGLPQEIAVDMGRVKSLKGFSYLPRQDKITHGMVDRYAFEISLDGKTWTRVSDGEFGNLRANPVEHVIDFAPVKARYFKFIALHALEKKHAALAEIGVIEAK